MKRREKHYRQKEQSIQAIRWDRAWHIGDEMKPNGQEEGAQGRCKMRSEKETGSQGGLRTIEQEISIILLKAKRSQ